MLTRSRVVSQSRGELWVHRALGVVGLVRVHSMTDCVQRSTGRVQRSMRVWGRVQLWAQQVLGAVDCVRMVCEVGRMRMSRHVRGRVQ